jgi:hypothetical protein
MENKRRPFTSEVHIKVADLCRGKYNHITTKQLEPDTWFQEANVSSLTLVIRDDHHNAQILVV